MTLSADELILRTAVARQVDTLLQQIVGKWCGYVLVYAPLDVSPEDVVTLINTNTRVGQILMECAMESLKEPGIQVTRGLSES